MNTVIRPGVEWLSAIAAFCVLLYEGRRFAEAISVEGMSGDPLIPVIIILAAFLAIRLLSAALASTVSAVAQKKETASAASVSASPSHM